MKALGIDIGTTSICVAGYEKGKEGLPFVASRPNAFLPGTFTQDPDRIVGKVMEMLEEAGQNGFGSKELDAIGISSQMHGILYVDQEGRAVSPLYTWKDEKGNEKYGEETYAAYLSRETGLEMYAGYGTVTHFYLGKNGKIPESAVKMAGIGDYLAMCLTGRREPLADASMAASFGGYELEKGGFALERLKKAGVEISYYPDLRGSGEFAGTWEDVPVSCAFGDNQVSFYGALEKPEEQVSVNVGTGSQVSVFDCRLFPESAGEIRPFFGKGYLYVGASLNGGKVYERLAAFFEETVRAFTGEEINAFEGMARMGACASQEGADPSLRVQPLLYGARGRQESEGGSISGLTFANFHPQDLLLAYVRGMAEELYRMYLGFPEEIRAGRKEIVASGNGIRKNPLLAQEVSALFGMPIRFHEMQEEAAAGAACAALGEKLA